MFTLFDLYELLGLALGLMLGLTIGWRCGGWVGCLAGVPVGLVVGGVCGRVPYVVARAVVFRSLRRKSAGQLRQMLRGPLWPAYHLFLAELLRRGEDIKPELDVVLPLLVSQDAVQRIHGWSILRRMYPDLAARVPDYKPSESAEACRARAEQAGLPHRGA